MSLEVKYNPFAWYKSNRRDFIHTSSRIVGGVVLSPLLSLAAMEKDIPADNKFYWYKKP